MEFAQNPAAPFWRCAADNSELITIALALYNELFCVKFDPLPIRCEIAPFSPVKTGTFCNVFLAHRFDKSGNSTPDWNTFQCRR